jgi:hypothetical protein
MGDFVGGVAAYDAGKYTRNVMRTNAVNVERDGAMQIERQRDTARIHMGRQLAGLASSGFSLDGSALDALRESAIESEMEIQQTRRAAASQAQGLKTQGQMAYSSGYNQMSGGIISGAVKIMDAMNPQSGGSNYASAK